MAEIRINATGGVKLYDADDSHYAQIIAGTITSNVDAITLGHDVVSIVDNLALTSDSAVLKFGADSEITLTHSADSGLLLKHTATADDKPINLVLQTGETDLAQDDVIGKIAFQAPDEGTGTDAILVSAAIQARAEGDHSSSSNATSIDFMTGASEAAAKKISITSAGHIVPGTDDTHDLGTSSLQFRNGYFDGTLEADVLTVGGTAVLTTVEFGDLSTSGTEGDNVKNRVAKAWINMNGTSTVAIRDDFNVGSITDNGTGDYTVTYSTNLGDDDYAVVAQTGRDESGSGGHNRLHAPCIDRQSTSSHRILCIDSDDDAARDMDSVYSIVFGDS